MKANITRMRKLAEELDSELKLLLDNKEKWERDNEVHNEKGHKIEGDFYRESITIIKDYGDHWVRMGWACEEDGGQPKDAP